MLGKIPEISRKLRGKSDQTSRPAGGKSLAPGKVGFSDCTFIAAPSMF
jgi:hypothetical protein